MKQGWEFDCCHNGIGFNYGLSRLKERGNKYCWEADQKPLDTVL
jgi:hypothetical protein